MTESQRHFLRGPASPSFVLSLLIATGAGGGYVLHQTNQFTIEQAQMLSAARDKYEALQQHCTEREFDYRGQQGGR